MANQKKVFFFTNSSPKCLPNFVFHNSSKLSSKTIVQNNACCQNLPVLSTQSTREQCLLIPHANGMNKRHRLVIPSLANQNPQKKVNFQNFQFVSSLICIILKVYSVSGSECTFPRPQDNRQPRATFSKSTFQLAFPLQHPPSESLFGSPTKVP